MSHTNGTIENFTSTYWVQREEIEILKLKLMAAIHQRDHLHHEFRNVIEAVQKWGFVELKDDLSGKKITLVEKAPEAKDPGIP